MTISLSIPLWILSAFPIVFLIGVMVARNWPASKAAPVTLCITIVSAVVFFRMNLPAVAVESGKGIWSAVSILLVVWPALLLYELSTQVQAFQVLRRSLDRFTAHKLMQIVLLGWIFPSFLQGITGFGVAVAVGAPLLVSIGVAPLWSVVIVLLCHSWGGTFGTLAIAWQALLTQVNVSEDTAAMAALIACILIWLYNFAAGVLLAWFYGKWAAVKEGFPVILLISVVQGGGQLLFSQINSTISCFLPACISMLVAAAACRTPKYHRKWELESGIMTSAPEQSTDGKTISFLQALFPYIVLTVLAIACLLIPPLNQLLKQWRVGFPFPASITGYGYETPAEACFSPLTPLTFAGTFLMFSVVIGCLYYGKIGVITGKSLKLIWKRTVQKAASSSVAILSLLVLSRIMSSSGQIYVLSRGIAQILGSAYLFVAPLVGMVGSFVTSSNMSSNILFGSFQTQMAEFIGLNASLLMGAQTAGGVIGTAFAPGNVILGTSTTGLSGQEGKIIRKVLPVALAMALIDGLLILVFGKCGFPFGTL